MSLKRVFKFAKPKNPGYGISKSFYLSVLAGHAQLPSPDEIANPQAARGAVEGFLAPLMSGSSKDDLHKPLARGVYALASRDRKTVLKMMVVSKEEAGFDTEVIAKSRFALEMTPEALARVRATWTLIQLTFESHDAMVAPALAFAYRVARKMAELTEGVVADAISQRYLLPEDVPILVDGAPLQALDHVSVQVVEREGKRIAYTLGLQKFAMSEFEMQDIDQAHDEAAATLLLSIAQTCLGGARIQIGESVGAKSAPFDVAPGGLDQGLWQGVSCCELIPSRSKSVVECLDAWLVDPKSR